MAGVKGRSGGHRAGAGRKASSAFRMVVRGGQDRAEVRPLVSAPVTSGRPEGLDARLGPTWDELAPLAVKAGTLVANTVPAFVRLCQDVARHAQMEAQIERDGLTYLKVTIDGAGQEHTEVKAHPLISRAQSLNSSIRAGMKDFAINPFGRPLAEALPVPVDPFEQFERVG